MSRFLCLFLLVFCNLSALSLKEPTGELKQPLIELLELFDTPTNLPIQDLVSYLQSHWVEIGKERYEMLAWGEEKKDQAFPLLKKLDSIDTIHAKEKHYSYAVFLGSTNEMMQDRLDFLYEEWERGVRFDQLIVLTGQRDLNPKIEKIPEELETETEIFSYLFDSHPLKRYVPCTIIDAPKQILNGKLRRPNTASTILEWLKTSPTPGKCLAISSQPFIGYQEAVMQALLPSDFLVEGVGPESNHGYGVIDINIGYPPPPYPLIIYLDSIAKWLIFEERMHDLDLHL